MNDKQEIALRLARLLNEPGNDRMFLMDRDFLGKVLRLVASSDSISLPKPRIEASREDVQQLLRRCYRQRY